MNREIFHSLKELEEKYLFYNLGPAVLYGDWDRYSRAVYVRGALVGTLLFELPKKPEIMSVLDAEEGEG
jgi:hypothetical protein